MTRALERCGTPPSWARGRTPMACAVAYSGQDQPPDSGTAANPCSQPVTRTLAPHREQARPPSPAQGHLSTRGDGSRQALES